MEKMTIELRLAEQQLRAALESYPRDADYIAIMREIVHAMRQEIRDLKAARG